MIYLDNSATGGFKPQSVYETVNNVVKYLSANPGRSGHRLSVTGAGIISDCRRFLAERFNAQSERVIFTKNCTEALNLAVFGSIKKGGKVITTVFEHNSVLRPLYELSSRGEISLEIARPSENKSIADAIEELITPDVYLIATTAVSNVTGERLPFEKIGKLAKSAGALYLVDGAQAGGHIPIDLKNNDISILALAGHKGLYGIMGSGVLILNDGVELRPLIYGGTGSESFSTSQPQCLPERLESGTHNLPAIASLTEGARYAYSNMENFSNHLIERTRWLISALEGVKGSKCYSAPNPFGIVAFELEGFTSAEVADKLNAEFDVAVRGGLHCAPLMHEYLGTAENGLVRVSISAQNSARELTYFIRAIRVISES